MALGSSYLSARTILTCYRSWESGLRREGGEGEKNKEEERQRGGNACQICFQKVIPPILSASNRNAVSGVKSC